MSLHNTPISRGTVQKSTASAKYYGDGEWYPAILGDKTSKGRMVLFSGYEEDGWQVGIT